MSHTDLSDWRKRLSVHLRRYHGAAGAFTATLLLALDDEDCTSLRHDLDAVERMRERDGFRDQAAYDAAVLNAVALAVRHARLAAGPRLVPRHRRLMPPMPHASEQIEPLPLRVSAGRYTNTMLQLPS